ncbi:MULTISPECIES: tripartite tricarboxylate transporter TctB family protein [Modicisalibacter]|uniref:tripartite tricarboxylate transporter TctB family protein n=1 Tax=Modicisalibacter TaxID=574347 RepID=UPI00100AFE7D|nr:MULTISPECIES: tripartite tricarboxylate transporter TctB family protein [Halomonadaceae]MBZ9560096.1 tripartite tricarboxylate transporter TctB family protein [Modicisalibacter sp. R2A 31.J]MBZ9576004.1 tripartite tricarboxylate transporter TctB family protein [Modicisalibacter sp. MOD 31.J]
MNRTADRVLGLVLIVLAAGAAAWATRFNVPFSYDPLGPKAFPMGLALILAVLSLVLVIRPGANGEWPDRPMALKLGLVLAVLLVYALLFTRLGYPLTSLCAVTVLARLFAASWRKALVTGVAMTVVTYFLFTQALGIGLPEGRWLSAWF